MFIIYNLQLSSCDFWVQLCSRCNCNVPRLYNVDCSVTMCSISNLQLLACEFWVQLCSSLTVTFNASIMLTAVLQCAAFLIYSYHRACFRCSCVTVERNVHRFYNIDCSVTMFDISNLQLSYSCVTVQP